MRRVKCVIGLKLQLVSEFKCDTMKWFFHEKRDQFYLIVQVTLVLLM